MSTRPLVGILIGSKSDWETMSHCAKTLGQLGIPYEAQVASAHRTPEKVIAFCRDAEARGVRIIIAAAGGAAHLAGFCAGQTHLPVLGVPMQGWSLDGIDSLLSTVQMPAGIPVGTLAIGKAGAVNSAVLAGSILALSHPEIREKLLAFRQAQRDAGETPHDLTI